MILPGYRVGHEIYRGRRRVVWRGIRESDARAVIIKAPADEFPNPALLAAMRREYRFLEQLTIPGVVRPVELVTWRDRVALVLEDLGDLTLKGAIATGPLSLDRLLEVGIELAGLLVALHREGIVHKDLTPGNIMLDSGSGRVTLADLGIATRRSTEPAAPGHPHALEGTIAYMSPEQTGRMNRDVDYRTDFYSLGVTLFEAATGRLPFESADALEVIHGHLARTPADPALLRPGLPRPLADLILRLLQKAPEERYQSARGILQDLRRMVGDLAATGGVADFTIGSGDVPDRFVVSPQLYGRENDTRRLREVFDRVAEGETRMVLVAGGSGIGKSSLIHELYAGLRGRGHLITGKFDQLARDVPYRALTQAFRSLIAQTLGGSDVAIGRIADQLRDALGVNAQVLVDVLPDLEQLLGPQPSAPSLGSTEAQNRFNRLFQRFVRIFAAPGHPLVLFLDDLQWADAATLSLLPLLLDREAIPGLLLIGAYRDNEVSPTHSLSLALAELSTREIPVAQVMLSPLSPSQVQQLLADSLRSSGEEAALASEMVFRKTAGNPFFVRHLLEGFARDGIISLDEAEGRWRLDLGRAEHAVATDNVVSLMAARIERLDPATQQILRLASCVGSRFDLRTLTIISEREPASVLNALWPAVDEGLVSVLDHSSPEITFRFLHDRVQQAAYALIPEGDRRAVHLTIGRLLLGPAAGIAPPDEVFEIVNHLDLGRELMVDPAELVQLAQLNLTAGRRAKASAAYPSALGFFSLGVQVLQRVEGDHHDLEFSLRLERGEAEYLTGRVQDAEATFLHLLEQVRSPLERADVCELLITGYETLSRYEDAIAVGLDGLRRLGITVPELAAEWEPALKLELEAIRQAIGNRTIASLAELPALENPALSRAMRLLQSTWTPSYITGKSRLGDLLVARLVLLSLQHGNCEASAFGYLHHAMTVGSYLQQYQRGAEFGQLALAVNERFADLRLRAVVHHRYAALVAPWRETFATCVAHAREAVQAAFESGNLPVAGYAEFQQAWYGMLLDPDLATYVERHRPTVDLLERLQISSYAQMQRVMLQWAAALRGETASLATLDGEGFSSAAYEATLGQSGIFRALYVTARLELLSMAGQHDEAASFAAAEQEAVDVFVGSIWPALFAFRHALTLTAVMARLPDADQRRARADLERQAARLARWADSAPANFRHMHLLVAAQIARIEDRPGDAMALFEEALDLTAQECCPRHRALVNELYAEFWLARRQPRVAHAFLAEARYGYQQWGAVAKVRQLDARYPDLLQRAFAGPVTPIVLQTTDAIEAQLDIAGILKAAQALVREMNLERLLERMMAIALEMAGADHGVLLLERDGTALVRVIVQLAGTDVLPEPGVPLDERRDLPIGIVQQVRRTRETLLVGNALNDERTMHDPYVLRERPRSVLCTPILNLGTLIGVLYTENRLTTDAFTAERVRVLQLLSAQAAIAIENAQLYGASKRGEAALRDALDEVRRLKDRLQTENIYLQEQIESDHGFEEIVGRSAVLRRVLTAVEQVAPVDTTVLISGETGTGKELLARAIHRLSTRRDHALVTVNCGAVAPGLVESELFGHEKGAFTGAVSRRLGRFEVADGGTLFLDEIGDLPLDLQVKLLRVLQEGEFQRVGGDRPIRVNVRVIAATHRDLEAQVASGKFRADLFYRLNVFPIRSPALRERGEDIPELVRYFVLKYATKLGKRIEGIPREVLERLATYAWPGNIRELANIIERSVILSRGTTLELEGHLGEVAVASHRGAPLRETQERQRMTDALEQTGWRVSGPKGAALLLGIKPTTLEARMKRLGLKRPG